MKQYSQKTGYSLNKMCMNKNENDGIMTHIAYSYDYNKSLVYKMSPDVSSPELSEDNLCE